MGGTNRLSNLEVLCEECHCEEHDGYVGDWWPEDIGGNHSDCATRGSRPKYRSEKAKLIHQATKAGLVVEFVYRKKDSDHSERRTIRPREIYDSGRRLYVVGHCFLRAADRNFRISRIQRIVEFRKNP